MGIFLKLSYTLNNIGEFMCKVPRVDPFYSSTSRNNVPPAAASRSPTWIRIQNICSQAWLVIKESFTKNPRLMSLIAASIPISICLGKYHYLAVPVTLFAAIFFDGINKVKNEDTILKHKLALEQLKKILTDFETENFWNKINGSQSLEELKTNLQYVIDKVNTYDDSISQIRELSFCDVFRNKISLNLCLRTLKENEDFSLSPLCKADIIANINSLHKTLLESVREKLPAYINQL